MATPPLRVVTYNVRYFGHALRGVASTAGAEQRIAKALVSLDPLPDLICLQEVETGSLRANLAHKEARQNGTTQLERLMTRIDAAFDDAKRPFPYEAFYFRAHRYRVRGRNLYTTGLAVIVNLATLHVDSHNVEAPHRITHYRVERWKSRKQTRICAHLTLADAADQRFHLFNTHLSLPAFMNKEFWHRGDKMGYGPNQVEEARSLARFVAENAGEEPFVVCGDFNAPPASPVFRYLTEDAGFDSAETRVGLVTPDAVRAFPTAGFMRLRMHLDHMFGQGVEWLDLDGTLRFGDRRGRFHGLSDHVPLIARFRLGG